MASPDLAVVLDRTGLDLLSGHCVCIFHHTCSDFLRNSDDETRFSCTRCRAKGLRVRNVTNRNCLRCGAFSPNALCLLCFDNFCSLVSTNLRLADNAVDLAELLHTFLPFVSPAHIAWTTIQLLSRAHFLSFTVVEEGGHFVARTRAWALIELWRKMLSNTTSIRIHAPAVFLGAQFHLHETVLGQAIELLPQKGILHTGGVLTMVRKKPTLTDDGYFALGKTLCASGLFEFYDKKRIQGLVGRYFVASKNDFVYYNDRPHLHIAPDPSLLEQWQTLAVAICAKPVEEKKI